MAGKGKLTIGILLGKKPGGPHGMNEEEEMSDGEETEAEGQGEGLPDGLVDAVQEMRVALEQGDDEAAATALMNAITCCQE